MPAVNLLIKPASSSCNLRCDYCFYHSLAAMRSTPNYGTMSIETLENLVKRAFEFADGYCGFAFQGGEPTLAGLPFYERLIELQEKYRPRGVQVKNFLQTNGIVLDKEWAKFLKDHDFLVGLSLDGPKRIHDLHRKDIHGRGTFGQVMNAAQVLESYQVEFNILSVVNSTVARHPQRIYNFMKKQGFNYLQFIPCLDALDGEQTSFSLSAEDYGRFLCVLFNLYVKDLESTRPVSIRYFDNLIQMALGYPPEACDQQGHCSIQFVIEADGGVYPCDFYVSDAWYMGNINEASLVELSRSPAAKEFVRSSLDLIHDDCRKCRWYYLCHGGCRRRKEPVHSGQKNLDVFCPGFQMFFQYAEPTIQEVARRLSWRLQGR
ncbi:MAG: anaerobic sulfatase maturase [Limnochordia bacterium]|nr:anaerobic sulfatase maturase [Limnochordia bacterium]MDD4517536.1 anaerobic sulfatase maturase [Limnochordia bacterium]